MAELSWLSVDDDEEVIWHDNPKLQKLLSITFTDYVVTDKAIYRKRGIFSRDVKKIGYDKIQNISFAQGILGKVFGYGDVDISTAGGSGVEMTFRAVEGPKEVQETINDHIRKEKESSSGKDVNTEILKELENIREVLENIEEKI